MKDNLGQIINLSYGHPPYDIHLTASRIGKDLLASVTGGTHSHIGAVALAEPSVTSNPVTGEEIVLSSIDDESSQIGECGCVVRVLTAAEHKDTILAEMFAKALCGKYGVNVCVTAGVHVDNATVDEIALMVKNAEELRALLIKEKD